MSEQDPKMSKMLERARKMKDKQNRELAEMKAKAKVGDDRVEATMNGHRALLSVQIAPELLSADHRQEIESLVVEAVNDALDEIDDKLGSSYGTLSSLPSLFSDYFDR